MQWYRLRPAIYLFISLVVVAAPTIFTVVVLAEPLPPAIIRPDVTSPPTPHASYSVLGQDTGILAGIDNQGQYLNALAGTIGIQTQMLVGLLVGLCILVAWLLQPHMQRGRALGRSDAAILIAFVACAIGSAYCGYRANVALLAQAAEAIVYHDGLEAPIAGQAGFLLAASVCAMALMFVKLVVAEDGELRVSTAGKQAKDDQTETTVAEGSASTGAAAQEESLSRKSDATRMGHGEEVK